MAIKVHTIVGAGEEVYGMLLPQCPLVGLKLSWSAGLVGKKKTWM